MTRFRTSAANNASSDGLCRVDKDQYIQQEYVHLFTCAIVPMHVLWQRARRCGNGPNLDHDDAE